MINRCRSAIRRRFRTCSTRSKVSETHQLHCIVMVARDAHHSSFRRSLLRLEEHGFRFTAARAELVGTGKLYEGAQLANGSTTSVQVSKQIPNVASEHMSQDIDPQVKQATTSPQSRQRPGRQTVGSDPTSWVTPAVSPTWVLSLFW
jgi:hypothetical protein